MILLTPLDLGLAALLVLASAVLGYVLRLGTARAVLVAAARTVVQLLLIGLVLETLFGHAALHWVVLLAAVMLLVAGREAWARQNRPLAGWWSFQLGTVSMFVSSFAVTVLALIAIIGATPWYAPQYAIPLLGMLLGNTMTGVALGMDRLTQTAWEQRAVIEARLILGQDWNQAIGDIRRNSIRSGMIPIVNAMAAAGVVSLPGMMTGQILAGAPPVEAVKYQILIMFLIAAGTIMGTIAAVWMSSRRLFDARERLRLDRLVSSGR
ncbi:MAG: iron export ABC transporter permease subunit FetB [Gammaproteobacteria bacterium]|nr:iron export ABC transporter permease subunit FetB [Gammaproteobacteria bacterium]NIR84174.1 iron export ABC transporter permease subunit FetB [Gammaproteobacteria bacterium]NIR89486.1 iron export ABC transporter permease subunit FetB [Gammaproteobacteria bacterium]NIU05329.1 iron export ABC transporter permease subunit FetB [Gammaproteobacteria bacterium]NIV52269.1 iron export ABC transporter permease subunit FetB [Gammaproteobacteria bacterium]